MLRANVNVAEAIHRTMSLGFRSRHALHSIKDQMLDDVHLQGIQIDSNNAYALLSVYQAKVQEWCSQTKTNYDQWHKEYTAKWFFEALKKRYNWTPERLQLSLI